MPSKGNIGTIALMWWMRVQFQYWLILVVQFTGKQKTELKTFPNMGVKIYYVIIFKCLEIIYIS